MDDIPERSSTTDVRSGYSIVTSVWRCSYVTRDYQDGEHRREKELGSRLNFYGTTTGKIEYLIAAVRTSRSGFDSSSDALALIFSTCRSRALMRLRCARCCTSRHTGLGMVTSTVTSARSRGFVSHYHNRAAISFPDCSSRSPAGGNAGSSFALACVYSCTQLGVTPRLEAR